MKVNQAHGSDAGEDSEHHLYEAIASIRTAEEAENFFVDLCTPAEIQAMADRWRVVFHIKNGKPYRQIYEETGVSATTVGRVARCLVLGKDGYNLIYNRIEKIKNEKRNKIKNSNTKKRASK